MRIQARRAEHHVEVGTRIRSAGKPHPDLIADHATGPVAAQHVTGPDRVCGPVAVAGRHGYAVIVLRQPGHGVASAQLDAGPRAQVRTQDVLDHRLRHLLARLGEPVITLLGQAERAIELGDPLPGQRLAEHDALRPRDRQRRCRPEPADNAPAAQMLHRPDAGRLGAGAPV